MTNGQTELPLGARRRDAGIADVLDRLTEEERRLIARRVLEQHQRFGASKVREGLGEAIIAKLEKHPNAMGGVFQRLAKRGYIAKTGRHVPSPRADRRNGEEAEWEVTPAGQQQAEAYA